MKRDKIGQSVPIERRASLNSSKTKTLKGGATANERRRYRSRQFQLRVAGALLLIGAIVYFAWLSPWAKPVRTFDVQIGSSVVGH